MKLRLAILLAALAALAAPAQSTAAEAVPMSSVLLAGQLLNHTEDSVSPVPGFRSGFTVEADGYKVAVLTFGDAVILEVWRGRKGERTLTAYLARGVAKPERLQATFGEFGKISMRFRESRNRTWFGKRRDCRGNSRFVKRRGVFVGNLRFRGEDGYVSLGLHRAKGSVVTVAKKCRSGSRFGGEDPLLNFFFFAPESVLMASERNGVDLTVFLALEGRKKTAFLGLDEETRGKLAIVRIAYVTNRSRLRANEALTGAGISPPAPFHGTGRYRAAPDGTATWSGSLSVNFPGAPRFPLTGPGFEPLLEVPF